MRASAKNADAATQRQNVDTAKLAERPAAPKTSEPKNKLRNEQTPPTDQFVKNTNAVIAACPGPNCAVEPAAPKQIDAKAARPVESRLNIIGGSEADRTMARDAHKRAVEWFAKFGKTRDKNVVIEFRDEVRHPESKERVHGYYNSAENKIYMTSSRAEFVTDKKFFGELSFNVERQTSYITHEISHNLFYGTNPHAKDLSQAVHEFVAYTVQLDTMDPQERQKVLDLFPDEEFEYDSHINDMLWSFNPHSFGIQAYKYFSANTDLLDKFYEGFAPSPSGALDLGLTRNAPGVIGDGFRKSRQEELFADTSEEVIS